MEWIPLTKASYSASEEGELLLALRSGRLEGDGVYTKKIHQFFEQRYQIKKALFTTSCTDALELAALLLDLSPGDEVIVPSYTFVSSAHPFALRGARIVFADSEEDHPNLSLESVRKKITSRTKAIVPVHYAGFACDMEGLMKLADQSGVVVIADAAQAVESQYLGRSIAQWGHLSAFSFHQTKNISSGEGGLLAINDQKWIHRAEILREKGTNRAAFFRGEIDKYTCVDIGSSFLASDLNASLLWAQLQRVDAIQNRRQQIWQRYHQELNEISHKVLLPKILVGREHNAHCYYLLCKNLNERTQLAEFLKERKITASFHYNSLHKSPYYAKTHDGSALPQADRYTDVLLRLPLYFSLSNEEQTHVIQSVKAFFKS